MKSPFQTIILIVFILAFVGAVVVFSGLVSPGGSRTTSEPEGRIVVWGVLPYEQMREYADSFNSDTQDYTITYEEHTPENMHQDLIVALANDNPPDVVLFSSEIFSQFKDKLYVIPYEAFSERTYRDTNIDGTQLFLAPEGVLGMPLVVDPLVVYYNKDILSAARFVVPPTTWTSVTASVPLLARRTAQNTIEQTALALGEADNVNHARDILSALFLQTGNPIVSYDTTLMRNESVLASGSASTEGVPAEEALTFYTSFSNPTNSNYSWNRSLPSSLDMFLAGRSAFYIGRASELFRIQAQNPNLNFDVTELFQADNAPRHITYGSFIAAGVMKGAPNFTAAYAFASALANPAAVDALSKAVSLPPVRRDLLQVQQNNPYVAVFFRAALSSFSWPDPNITRTQQIFRGMITNVTSGRTDAQTAIYEAARDIQSSIQ